MDPEPVVTAQLSEMSKSSCLSTGAFDL